MCPLITLLLVFLTAASVSAATYVVHADGTGDYPTIHAAIMACGHGDVVELTDGVYSGPGNRDLTNNETAVLIRSQNGNAANCVIHCGGSPGDPHRFITLVITGEAPRDPWGLHDLTIMGGYYEYGGAVQVADWAQPEIFRCRFVGNSAESIGGAIYGAVGFPMIEGCEFVENAASWGGAIGGNTECGFLITDCTFYDNVADEGGAIYSRWDLATEMYGCTFVRNEAALGAGLCLHAYNTIELERCLVAFNYDGAGVHVDDGQVNLACCDLFGNEGGDWVGSLADQLGDAGNVTLDPLFCSLDQNDLSLHESSPCLPGTDPNPECGLIGAWPSGCGAVGTKSASWGSVKALFR